MKKSDLECGNVVELRNGGKLLFCPTLTDDELIDLTGYGYTTPYTYYCEDLTNINGFENLDIMKVYKDHTCKELLWERKEKPKLTEVEKVILRNIPEYYKWLARDIDGCLYVYASKPKKGNTMWEETGTPMIPFYHLFQFIKWGDEEPCSIEELLRENKNDL